MNPNQIINMIVRMVMRRLINTGINKGIDMASKRGASKRGGPAPDDTSPEARASRRQANETAKRARQAMRVTRRIGRF